MPPAAGIPPAAGAATGGSIDEILLQADQLAQEIIAMDPLNRRRTLIDIKNQNEALHAQVTAKIDEYEQMAATQGVQMARAGQM
jgi:hypothetical protein